MDNAKMRVGLIVAAVVVACAIVMMIQPGTRYLPLMPTGPINNPTRVAQAVQTYVAATGTLTVTQPDPYHMPMLPGATEIPGTPGDVFFYQITSRFETDLTEYDVTDFYSRILPAQGWVALPTPLADTGPLPTPIPTVLPYVPFAYIWSDDKGPSRSQYLVFIYFNQLQVWNWPNPIKLPLYEDAFDVTREYQLNADYATAVPNSEPLWRYIVTYRTNSTTAQLASFYDAALSAVGWARDQGSRPIYRYDITGYPERGYDRSGKVEIVTQEEDAGLRVTLTVDSSELKGADHP